MRARIFPRTRARVHMHAHIRARARARECGRAPGAGGDHQPGNVLGAQAAGQRLTIRCSPGPGGAAIQRFLEENDRFEIDRTRERFILSNNLTGFLKRVK